MVLARQYSETWALFSALLRAVGVITSIIGTYFVRAKNDNEPAMKPINRGFMVSSVLSIIGFAALTIMYTQGSIFNIMSTDAKWANVLAANPDANVVLAWKLFAITTIGIFLSFAISAMTEYFTSTETKPVQEIAKATLTGPATTILSGTAEGMESSVWAILSIAVAIASSIIVFAINPIGDAILVVEQTLYGVSLLGLGMLTVTGIIVAGRLHTVPYLTTPRALAKWQSFLKRRARFLTNLTLLETPQRPSQKVLQSRPLLSRLYRFLVLTKKSPECSSST